MRAADPHSVGWWGALVLALGVSARAHAAEPLELSWRAPSGCPGASQVLERVRGLAGAVPNAPPQLRAEALIARAADGGLRLHLITHVGALKGERIVEGKSCDDLANTVAIHLALLLQRAEATQPSTQAGPQPTAADAMPARAPAAASVSPVENVAAPAQPVAPLAGEPRNVFGLLQLPLLAASLGPLPRLSPGLALAGGAQIERVRVLAEARVWLGQRLTSEREPTLGADLDRISAHVRACRAIGTGAWEVSPCVLVGLEHLWASGSGAHLAARTAQSTWITAGAGAQLRYALVSWLGLVLRVDAQLQLSRPRISVGGLGDIGRLGPAAFTLSLGAEWIL